MKHMRANKDQGAIGIGTLIIFIALILVAAIAAAVIISTAESLEEKAEAAKNDAERLVRSSPMIMIAEGTVDATTGNIDQVDIYIDLYGSEGVDMRDVVLHVVATPSSGNAISDDLTFNTNTPGQATSAFFGTSVILDPLGQFNPSGTPPTFILGERARLKLTIDLSSSGINVPLPEASSLEIYTHVTTSGHERYDFYRTPSAFPSGGVVTLEE